MAPSARSVTLESAAGEIAGVGPKFAEKLGRLGVKTAEDLLRYFPRRYDDFSKILEVADLATFGGAPEGPVTVRAEVLGTETRRMRSGRGMLKASIGSTKGFIEAVWFNQPYVAKQLTIGETYLFSGKLRYGYGRFSLQNPTFEHESSEHTHTARLVSVYPETEGLSSKWLRTKVKTLLPLVEQVPESLPDGLRKQYELLDIHTALQQIHFPDTAEQADRARYRFDFEQLLMLQLLTLSSRANWQSQQNAPKIGYDAEVTRGFVGALPWPLTDEQRRAAHEILGDLDSDVPMLRLLQGDVGSGKTVVAAIALHQAVSAGWQAALMVPTEVLARQHAATLREWFGKLGMEVVELLGSQSVTDKQAATKKISGGSPLVVVGTHALIQESVEWGRLAVAVVDEQHRFGVKQRSKLRGQHTPHLLTMTATPIPRSLALVAYGDQSLSAIMQPPAGRQPVITKVIPRHMRDRAFTDITIELSAGRQAFIVYPVIEESVRGLKDATSEYERLQSTVFSAYRTGLLHGRMKPVEKEEIMRQFVARELDVLVSTSVIEVGVDVPNATVMVIEEAQQFGLAQLHQFRGRVGRGEHQSYAYLMPGETSTEDNERLQAMGELNSGFELAEVDLRLRGPGDLLGTKQSGFDISLSGLTNPQLLKASRRAAEEVIADDPELKTFPRVAEDLAAGDLRD